MAKRRAENRRLRGGEGWIREEERIRELLLLLFLLLVESFGAEKWWSILLFAFEQSVCICVCALATLYLLYNLPRQLFSLLSFSFSIS